MCPGGGNEECPLIALPLLFGRLLASVQCWSSEECPSRDDALPSRTAGAGPIEPPVDVGTFELRRGRREEAALEGRDSDAPIALKLCADIACDPFARFEGTGCGLAPYDGALPELYGIICGA